MKRVTRMSVIMMAAYLAMILPAYAEGTGDDPSFRKGRWEVLFAPQYTLVKHLAFDGGTTAKINDTWGFNFQFGYNFNEHWNLGGIFSWSRPDYQAAVQPAAGNTSPPISQSGTLETNTFALITTYNVLPGPVTPYIDGNIGGTHINTDVAAGPPVAGCYWDPWYGYICEKKMVDVRCLRSRGRVDRHYHDVVRLRADAVHGSNRSSDFCAHRTTECDH